MAAQPDQPNSFEARVKRHPGTKDVPVRSLRTDGPRVAGDGFALSRRSTLLHDSERDTTLTEAFEQLLQEAYFQTKNNSVRQVTEDAVVTVSHSKEGVTLEYDPAGFIPGKPFAYVNPEPENAASVKQYEQVNQRSALAERQANLTSLETMYDLLGEEFKKRGIEFSMNHETHAFTLHYGNEHDLQFQLQDLYHSLHSERLKDVNHRARITAERTQAGTQKGSFLDF